MNNEHYEKFLKILKETNGIHNSLHEILKYGKTETPREIYHAVTHSLTVISKQLSKKK